MKTKPCSILRNLDVDESADIGVAKPCELYGWYLYNNKASAVYLKLYDSAAAATLGTDTPVMTIGLPASSAANLLSELPFAYFSKGISVGATTDVADAGTTALAANDLVINLFYRTV